MEATARNMAGAAWMFKERTVELTFPVDVYNELTRAAGEEGKTVEIALQDEIIKRVRGKS